MGSLAGHPYVTRAGWGATIPQSDFARFSLPAHRCYVHHTASEQHGAAGVRAIERYHVQTKGWRGIAYTYLIDDDGTIYEGRGHQYIGGHTTGENSTSHAICLMGNFDQRKPTPVALRSLADLGRHGVANRWWAAEFPGHRDSVGANTACPGRHLYAKLPAVRVAIAQPSPPSDQPPSPQEDPDMAFTDAHAAKLEALYDGLTSGRVATQVWAHDVASLPTRSGAAADYLRRLVRASGTSDAAEVAALVLASLTPQAIAAAIPKAQAAAVADELAARLVD